MNKKLKNRIKEFNKIKYPQDNSKRIIVASLNADIKKLGWGVTQGCKDKE